MTASPINWEQRWRDQARRLKQCPECGAPVAGSRAPSYYCSPLCVDFMYRREFEIPRAVETMCRAIAAIGGAA